jgi:hypothetical protein
MKRGLLLGFCCCLCLAACKRAGFENSQRCDAIDAGTPVDPLLLAFLSRARSAHHIADEQETAGDLAAAVAPLAALTEGPLPREASPALAPEVREVLADTRARLADLRSRQGAFEPALADIRAGLESAREPNYFRGHLLETEGLVEERQAKALETKNPNAAAAARARAIGLLEQAMAVQASVIDSAAPGSNLAKPSASAGPNRVEPQTPSSAP